MEENKDIRLEKLQKAVNTFVTVSDKRNLESKFEEAKKNLIQEFNKKK